MGDDYEQARQLSAGQQKDAATNTDMPALASYQFAIRPRQPSNQWRSRLLLGLAVGETHSGCELHMHSHGTSLGLDLMGTGLDSTVLIAFFSLENGHGTC